MNFLSEGVVAATFLARESLSAPQRREDPSGLRPYKLHALFFDAASGKLLKSLDWPIDDPAAGIFPRYDNSFLVFTSERMILYDSKWAPVKEFPLPQFQELDTALAQIAESPGGKALRVRIRQGYTPGCVRINTATLEGSQEPCATELPATISDSAVAWPVTPFTVSGEGEPEDHRAMIIHDNRAGRAPPHRADEDDGHTPITPRGTQIAKAVVRQPGEPVLTVRDSLKDSACWGAQFINDGTMIVRSGDSISLLDVARIGGFNLSPAGEKLVVDSGGVIQAYALPSG